MERRSFKYEAIANRLEDQIRRKVYRFGEQIPSIRELCRIEKASPGIIYQAMGLLEARGLIEARPRSGYYVAARTPSPATAAAPVDLMEPRVVGMSNIAAEIMREAGNPNLVPLGAAIPAPELFPTEKLSRLMASVVRTTPSLLGRYELAPAHPELMRQLEQWFYAMKCPVRSDEIVVANGATEALNLAIRAVTRPGDVVAVESPTYFGLLQILESLGLKALMIPGDDEHGISLDRLAEALQRYPVKAVVVIPSYNNPTGACLNEERRIRLLSLLGDLPLVEDDVYGNLYFGSERPRPIKTFDRKGQVIYCTSASKTLAASLRVGWVAAGRYAERVRRLKWISTLTTSPLDQLTLARYLASESIDRHLRRLRQTVQKQVTAMRRAILEHFPPGTIVNNPTGGLFLWVRLPEGADSVQFYHRLIQEGILVMPDKLFCPLCNNRRAVRISCGVPFNERIEWAIQRAGELLRCGF